MIGFGNLASRRRAREVRREVGAMVKVLGASSSHAPTFEVSEESGRPHVEITTTAYHYVQSERGQEFKRDTFTDLQELLLRIARDMTSLLAFEYEFANRREVEDCRRLAFARQRELLERISPTWSARAAEEQDAILSNHPFDDAASMRASLTKEYRDQGHSDQTAWQKACAQYPLPRRSATNS